MPFDFALIDHLVVVMFENRSFDHMLGALQLETPPRNVDGLLGKQDNLDIHGYAWSPHELRGHLNDIAPQAVNRVSSFSPDPPHERLAVRAQIATGKMNGFVIAFQQANPTGLWNGFPIPTPHPEDVLGYYTRTHLPVLYFLADQGAVCDRWFCSVPTSTMPNRLYSLCGDSKDHDATPINDYKIPLTSVFDLLPNPDWAIYSATLSDVAGIFLGMGAAIPGCMAMYLGDLDEKRKIKAHWRDLDDFKNDAEQGVLPKVTWIEPCDENLDPEAANNDHPPTAIENGQQLMKTIYDALSSNPARWQKTVLVITYDEHGGFYDHVAPDPIPAAALSPTDKSKAFNTFGPRVPAIILSPLITEGAVIKDQLEHCSILRFICDWFHVDPRLLSPRVEQAASIEIALTRAVPSPGPGPAGAYLRAPEVQDLSGWEFGAMPPGVEKSGDQKVSGMKRQAALLRDGLEKDSTK